jgi:coenzyme PQQ precursor peptide PqqA
MVEAANALILGDIMQWTAPVFEEVCLNCEINSYASAQL